MIRLFIPLTLVSFIASAHFDHNEVQESYGLEFSKNEKISLQSEHLFFSKEFVTTTYKLKNTSKKSTKVKATFPIPELDCAPTGTIVKGDFTKKIKTSINNKKIDSQLEQRIFQVKDKKEVDITKEVRKLFGKIGCRNLEFENLVKEHIVFRAKDEKKYKYSKTTNIGTYYSNYNNALNKYMKLKELGYTGEFEAQYDSKIDFPWGPSWKLKQKYNFEILIKPGKTVTISHQYEPLLNTFNGMEDEFKGFHKLKDNKIWYNHLPDIDNDPLSKSVRKSSSSFSYAKFNTSSNLEERTVKNFKVTIKKGLDFTYTNLPIKDISTKKDLLIYEKTDLKVPKSILVFWSIPSLVSKKFDKKNTKEQQKRFELISADYDKVKNKADAKKVAKTLKNFILSNNGTVLAKQAISMYEYLLEEYKLK